MVEFLKKQITKNRGFSDATSYKRGDARERERVALPSQLRRTFAFSHARSIARRKPPATKADFFLQRQILWDRLGWDMSKKFRTYSGSVKLYAFFCIKEKQWDGHLSQQLLRKSVAIEKHVRYMCLHTHYTMLLRIACNF